MKLPKREQAAIEESKLTEYLLNPEHRRGGDKARLLIKYGYRRDNWQQLEADIRRYHLSVDVSSRLIIRRSSNMNFPLYTDVILQRDLPQENLQTGDIGTVVERHDVPNLETGYSVEFFDMLGRTVALITVPGSWLRVPNHDDRLSARKEAIEVSWF